MKLDEINQNIRQKMFYKQKKYEEMEKEKMKWEKAIKISCWYCDRDMGVIILQKDVSFDQSKLYGIYHVCKKCLHNTKEMGKKVLPIIQ